MNENKSRFWSASLLVPLGFSLLLLALCATHSRSKPFWTDELLVYYPISSPSFGHMLSVYSHVNVCPPLYFAIGWVWFHLFGGSELSLRLLSSVAFVGAIWVLWGVLKPKFGAFATAIGLIDGFFTIGVLSQNTEVRFYGQYIFTAALVVWAFDAHRRSQVSTAATPDIKRPAYRYSLNFAAHLLLIFTHTFGLLYSGCVFLAQLIEDLFAIRQAAVDGSPTRPRTQLLANIDGKFYGSIVLAWVLFFALWFLPDMRHRNMRESYEWAASPTLRVLVEALVGGRKNRLLLCLGVGLLLLVRRFMPRRPTESIAAEGMSVAANTGSDSVLISAKGWRAGLFSPQGRLLLLAVLQIVIPEILIFLVSKIGIKAFVGRYFLPAQLSWATLIAAIVGGVVAGLTAWVERQPTDRRNVVLRAAPLLGIALALGTLFWSMPPEFRHRAPRDAFAQPGADIVRVVDSAVAGSSFASEEGGPLPIVFNELHSFNAATFYATGPSRFFYLTDKASAYQIKSDSTHFADKEEGMIADDTGWTNVMPWADFLRHHRRFAFYDPAPSDWLQYRVLSTGHYRATDITPVGLRPGKLFLVNPQ